MLLVVIFHAQSIAGHTFFPYSFGGMGVKIFFIISGFIMAYIHGNDRGISEFVLFLKKRIARIFPLYWIILFIFIAAILYAGKGGDFHRNGVNLVLNIFLLNIPSLSVHPYAWSLVYEMFYYYIFSVFVILFSIPISIFSLLLIFFPILFINNYTDEDILFLSINNIYFGFGLLVGFYWNKIKYRIFYSFIPFFLFLCMIIYSCYGHSELYRFFLCTFFFISYMMHSKSINYISYVGSASYSIYLSHALLVPIASSCVQNNLAYYPLLILFCLILGIIIHKYVEKKLVLFAEDVLGVGRNKK